MGRKSVTVELGSFKVQVTQLPGELAALSGMRIGGLLGPLGVSVLEEYMESANLGPELRARTIRAVFEALARIDPREIKDIMGLYSRTVDAKGVACMRLLVQVGNMWEPSPQPFDFDATFDDDEDRVWYYFTLFLRATEVNFDRFFVRLATWSKSRIAAENAKVEASKPPSPSPQS